MKAGGRNRHLHHEHHGGLTLSAAVMLVVGVGVDSCLLLNDQFTGYSILIQHPHQHHGGVTLVSGCDVGAVDSCLQDNVSGHTDQLFSRRLLLCHSNINGSNLFFIGKFWY